MENIRQLDDLGAQILQSARNELYLHLPYLDVVLCGLAFQPGRQLTLSLATDGQVLHYNGSFLAERYLRSPVLCSRAYLHVLLHCMLRHLHKKYGRVPELWDLACDVAAESILDGLHYPCLELGTVPAKEKFYGQCRSRMPVITAEGVYRMLLQEKLPEYRVAQLQRVFVVDDHGLWAPPEQEGKERSQRQDEQWKDRSEKTQTSMETVLAGQATGGEPVLEQVKVALREDVDLRAFLRRFAAPREVMAVDGDGFDYSYYSYGLQLYGNMPLIEYPETREEKRIRDLVIAIDTSMSTNGQLVRQFLSCTYSILRSQETYTNKVNIHILQCDDRVRHETRIDDLEQLRRYMDDFALSGGSATDFRPVFQRVEQLQQEGVLSDLRGLLYFTDGMGIYPQKRPPYDTAFVLLEEPPLAIRVPPWAIKLVLGLEGLEKTVKELDMTLDTDAEELPQL